MKFLDLQTQYQRIKPEIDEAIHRVIESGVYVGQDEEEVRMFEKEMTQYCGSKFAVGVNSGTDALFLSLKALGIGKGDEVLTTPFTFIASVSSIVNVGATPVFVDIDPETFNMDTSQLEEKITARTKVIMPVHIFGQVVNMTEVLRVANEHNLYIVEDAAQAIGAEFEGSKAGTFGNAGCFSFFPTKNLGAFGDGGMIIGRDEEFGEQIRMLKNHGSSVNEKYHHMLVGTNSRLDALQAAILRVKLRYLRQWSNERRRKALHYSTKLQSMPEIHCPVVVDENTHIYHQYTIRVLSGKRDAFQDYLKRQGIPTFVYYRKPLHLQPALRYLGYKEGDFPKTEKAAEEVISLPLYPELSSEEQDAIISHVQDFFTPSG
jgi:dTDP-4-amino-4,6-dideoxygalactose transaminase